MELVVQSGLYLTNFSKIKKLHQETIVEELVDQQGDDSSGEDTLGDCQFDSRGKFIVFLFGSCSVGRIHNVNTRTLI